MTRWVPCVLGLVSVACGGASPGIADAAPADAGPGPDGSPPPVGTWRLDRETRTIAADDGGVAVQVVTTGTSPLSGGHTGRVNGAMTVTADELAVGVETIVDGRLASAPETAAFVSSFAPLASSSPAFVLAGLSPLAFTWQRQPTEELVLRPDAARVLTFVRRTPAASDTLAVGGVATLSAGAGLASPRVVLVFLVRTGSAVEYLVDTASDHALVFQGSQAVLDGLLDRAAAPPPAALVAYGPAAIALGLIVIYDDVAPIGGNGQLDIHRLEDKCTIAGDDCVKGIGELVLVYRTGSSAELAASPFAYVGTGWTQGRQVADYRHGVRLGLVSLDTATPVPFDVTIPASPLGVNVPELTLR